MDTYIIYRHKTPNGKVYIGQTKKTAHDRWKANGLGYTCHEHGFFWKAIRKYGWENIRHEILVEGLSKEDADRFEKLFIALYQSDQREYGYNARSGGTSGYVYSEQSKRNISEGLKRHYKECGKPDTSKARAVLQKKQARKIAQYNLTGLKIAVFDSAIQAEQKTGVGHKSINAAVCKGKDWAVGGYMWRYAEDAPDKIPCYKKHPRQREVILLNEQGVEQSRYKSIKEAARKTGFPFGTIQNSLKNRYKEQPSMCGFRFIYAE